MSTRPSPFEGHSDSTGPTLNTHDLLARIWPWPLRLASWATAHRRGLVSLDEVVARADCSSALELGPLIQRHECWVGLLYEPGAPPPVAVAPEHLPLALEGGGVVLGLGSPATVLTRTDAGALAQASAAAGTALPPADSIGAVERDLLGVVTRTTDVFTDLALTRSDAEAAGVLAKLPKLLDTVPMPPGTTGRARLLRDRSALLIAGTELALSPSLAPPTLQLDAIRRAELQQARQAGRVALQAAANEQAYLQQH